MSRKYYIYRKGILMSETENAVQTPQPEAVHDGFHDAPNAKKILVLIALFCAVIGQIFQSATLSTLLPVAAAEIGGQEIYSLASALGGVLGIAGMPLWGLICSRNANMKRWMFFLSMAIGVVALLMRAFAGDMVTVIVSGVLYGLVSPGIFVVGYTLVRDLFDAKKAAGYLGIVATLQGVAMLLGPIVAGAIMDAVAVGGWRIVCHIIWPFWAIAGILVLVGTPKLTAEQNAQLSHAGGKLDMAGIFAITIFLCAFLLALGLGNSFIPWGTPLDLGLFAVALVALIVLIFIIRKKKETAVISSVALKDRNVLSMTLSNFFANFANMAVFFFIPTYCLYVLGTTATQAGLATSMLSIAPLFMGPIFGRMVGKAASAKGVLVISQSIRIAVNVALVILCLTGAPLIAFYIVLFIGGFYGASTGVGYSAGPQVQLKEEIRVQGNSVVSMGQNLGSSIGTCFYTILIGAMGVGTGLFWAFGIAAVAALISLIFALRLKKLGEY